MHTLARASDSDAEPGRAPSDREPRGGGDECCSTLGKPSTPGQHCLWMSLWMPCGKRRGECGENVQPPVENETNSSGTRALTSGFSVHILGRRSRLE